MGNKFNVFQNTALSLEDIEQTAKPQAKREDELVVYAKINNFDGLQKAQSKESHEQWQIPTPNGKIRVRKTTKDSLAPQYSMAIKVKDNALGGTEHEETINAETFESFKSISINGMIKDRYIFAASKVSLKTESGKQAVVEHGVLYEVDVFPKSDGTGYHDRCKIDIEVNKLLAALKAVNSSVSKANFKINVSELPFQPSDMVVGNHNPSSEQKALIDKWYKEIFLSTPGQSDKAPSNLQENVEKTNESQKPPKPKALQEKVAEAGDVPPAKQESTDTESEDVSKDDDSGG